MASYPGGARRPRETGRCLHSSHKMACAARASASCQPCPDFGQEGALGQLWSGQSLTSPTQENICRAFGAQRRVPGAYSLLPELPGHLLCKTLKTPWAPSYPDAKSNPYEPQLAACSLKRGAKSSTLPSKFRTLYLGLLNKMPRDGPVLNPSLHFPTEVLVEATRKGRNGYVFLNKSPERTQQLNNMLVP